MSGKKRILLGQDGPEQLLSIFGESRRFPAGMDGFEARVNFLREETCVLLTPVELDEGWYLHCVDPILARDADGISYALVPDAFGRYCFYDEGLERIVRVTAKNCRYFLREAYSAARKLPAGRVGARGLFALAKTELTGYEAFSLLLLTALCVASVIVLGAVLAHALSKRAASLDAMEFALTVIGLPALTALGVVSGALCRRVLRRVSQKVCAGLTPGMTLALSSASPLGVAALSARLTRLPDQLYAVALWLLRALLCLLATVALCAALFLLEPAYAPALLIPLAALWTLCVMLAARSLRLPPPPSDESGAVHTWLLCRGSDRVTGSSRPIPVDGAPRRLVVGGVAALCVLLALLLPVLAVASSSLPKLGDLARHLILALCAAAASVWVLFETFCAREPLRAIHALLPALSVPSERYADFPPAGSVLELQHVSFTYPNDKKPLLTDVSLRIAPGERVGICGATGTGKSTLARLLRGVLTPQAGIVYYGGIDLRRCNPASLRRAIATGGDAQILLMDETTLPDLAPGQAAVLFSTRRDALAGCGRVYDIEEGKLIG